MPNTMKNTCKGCRALEWSTPNYKCKLGYEIDTIYDLTGIIEIFPLEPCPKPLTFDAYFQITQAKENLARVQKFNIDLKSIS